MASYQESIQIIAGAGQFDETIPASYDFKKMTKDAVKGTGAPADWEKDEEAVADAEEQQTQVNNLTQTATALREGAGVATDVAGATVALKEAGLV
ncbi:hypothetical protein D3C87_1746770 [compost metagenome]